MAEPVVDVAVGQPAPALQSCVARYVGYRQEGIDPRPHQGLPSGFLTLIVSLAAPIDIAVMPGPAQAPGTFGAFVAGLHTAPATIRQDRSQAGVHLDLTPLGARALLGVPAGALAGTVVDLGDVLGARAGELADRLAGESAWGARFAVLDDVFSRRLGDTRPVAAEVAWAWERLVATGGAIEVGALARESGWSRRHLGERFRAELGLTPKAAARVLRFDCARRLLGRPSRPPLADVAARCGYFDQAHLTRDWRQLAGCTPTRWLADELPSVQDGAPLATAS